MSGFESLPRFGQINELGNIKIIKTLVFRGTVVGIQILGRVITAHKLGKT